MLYTDHLDLHQTAVTDLYVANCYKYNYNSNISVTLEQRTNKVIIRSYVICVFFICMLSCTLVDENVSFYVCH